MLTPKTYIAIGGKMRFTGCNEFSVKRSVEELSATGVVYLPTLAMFDSKLRKTIAVREEAQAGDDITIHAGYDEHAIYELFKGYIKAVNTGTKVKLDIEDAMYMLRRMPIVLTIKKVTLKTLLEKLLNGTGVTVSERTADMQIDEFQYNGNVAGALAVIKEKLNLTVYINRANSLYAGLEAVEMLSPADRTDATINITYGKNVVSNNVEYQTKESKPLKIVVKGKGNDGKEVVVTSGMDGGDVQTHMRYNITDKKSLQLIADQLYSQQSYDGFRGTLTLWGLPLAIPGGTVVYKNDSYKDVEGKYFIKAVETSLSTSGLRQQLTMGYKL